MRIGIDLGGTKIEGIAIADDGSERLRRRIAAPRGDYAQHARRRGRSRARHRARARPSRGRVGVGIPGTISQATGRIKNANSTWLNGTPLADDLSRMLDRPVRLRQRRELLRAVGGDRRRGGRRAVVFGVIIGTGTGGGIVVDGRVLTGANGDRGRMGTQPAPGAARGRIAWSVVLLRPQRLHRDVSLGAGPGARLRRQRRSRRQRARRSRLAPPPARRWRSRRSNDTRSAWRARSAASSTFSTRTSSCSAAGCRISAGCTSACRSSGARTCSPTGLTTRLVRAVHGDSSGVRGAAWLWEIRESGVGSRDSGFGIRDQGSGS